MASLGQCRITLRMTGEQTAAEGRCLSVRVDARVGRSRYAEEAKTASWMHHLILGMARVFDGHRPTARGYTANVSSATFGLRSDCPIGTLRLPEIVTEGA